MRRLAVGCTAESTFRLKELRGLAKELPEREACEPTGEPQVETGVPGNTVLRIPRSSRSYRAAEPRMQENPMLLRPAYPISAGYLSLPSLKSPGCGEACDVCICLPLGDVTQRSDMIYDYCN